MAFSRPLFTITRPQSGRVVPLIPADLLPEGIVVGGYPRSLTPQEMIGTVDLGVVDWNNGGAQPSLQLCISPEDPGDRLNTPPLSRADSLEKDIRDLLNNSPSRSRASDQNSHVPDEDCSAQGLAAELEANTHQHQTKPGAATPTTEKKKKSKRKPIHKGRRARMASVAKREASVGEQVLPATQSVTSMDEVVWASPTGSPIFLRSPSSAESKRSDLKSVPDSTVKGQDDKRAPLGQEESGEKDTAAACAASSSIQEEELLIEL